MGHVRWLTFDSWPTVVRYSPKTKIHSRHTLDRWLWQDLTETAWSTATNKLGGSASFGDNGFVNAGRSSSRSPLYPIWSRNIIQPKWCRTRARHFRIERCLNTNRWHVCLFNRICTTSIHTAAVNFYLFLFCLCASSLKMWRFLFVNKRGVWAPSRPCLSEWRATWANNYIWLIILYNIARLLCNTRRKGLWEPGTSKLVQVQPSICPESIADNYTFYLDL